MAIPGTDAGFWNKLADRYAARPVDHPDAYDETLARTRTYLTPDATVLEVGCGTGTTALRLCDAVGHYTATDYAPRMIEIAQEKAKAAPPGEVPNLTFRAAPLDEPDPTRYDVVLAFNLLHLTSDVPAAIAALSTRLKPGGLLITKTPCLGDLSVVLRVVVPAMRLVGKAPHVTFLRRPGLERMIADAGHEIIETGDYPARWAARFVVARRG